MTRRFGRIVWLLAGIGVAGCNQSFAFDVHGADAGASVGGSSDAGSYDLCQARCDTWNQVCASEWMVCVECNSDTDCTAPGRRRCWAEDHRCVACTTDTDCAAGEHCVSQTGECRIACNYSGGDDACGSEGEHCSNSNVCLTCDRDVECAGSSRGSHCLPGAGYCVACVKDADCLSTGLTCDTVTHSCVACKDGRDCSSGCCNVVSHSCY